MDTSLHPFHGHSRHIHALRLVAATSCAQGHGATGRAGGKPAGAQHCSQLLANYQARGALLAQRGMEQQAKLAESLLEENEAMAKQYNQQVQL